MGVFLPTGDEGRVLPAGGVSDLLNAGGSGKHGEEDLQSHLNEVCA